MDDSANPIISITDSREANENEQMFSKNQNLKKTPMKHFMAPTISATSKVAIPRKKILTERNESSDSSETHQQNTPNLVPKTSQVHLHNSSSRTFSRKTASESRFYESDDDKNKDSSSKPYDPLTNYLSPRPKFLRYNPNRSRGMYNRQEFEIENDVEGSDGRSSSVSYSSKSSDEIGTKEIDIVNKDDDYGLEDDDEEEIEDIENADGFSWIGFFKFTLVSVVLMLLTWYISCMNPMAPTMHLIRGSTNGYINGYNHTYDIIDVSSTGEELVKPIDHVSEEGWEVCLKPIEEGVEVELKLDVIVLNHEEDENVSDQNFRIKMGVSDQVRGIGMTESAEKPEPFQDDQTPTFSDHDKGIEFAETGDKFEPSDLVDTHVSDNEEIGNSVSLDNEVEIETIGEISAEEDGKAEENNMESDDIAEEESSLEFSSTKDSESNLINGAFVVILVIIASLILAFYLKSKRTPFKISQSIKKPVYNTISTENIISEDQSLPNLEEAHIKKVESYVNYSTYFVEEKARDYPSRAPTVELLGEFVVGDVRSSMKSCNLKSKTKEAEVKPKEMESQGDTNSVFLDNVVNSRSIFSTPELSASNAMDSPSYGSFTDKKKIVKKEEGSAMTTPVRRSSRIRNRLMSP